MGEWIQLRLANGEARAYVAEPHAPDPPGVLVLHAWWGLNDFFVSMCDRLAEAGFRAVAPDLFQGKTASEIQQAEALVGASDSDFIFQAATAALDDLAARADGSEAGLGAIGCSFGAAWAVLLSTLRPDVLRAVVVFYGAYVVDFSTSQAAYQGHFAVNDEWEPLDGVQAMEAAMQAASCQTEFYYYPAAGHWFIEENRPADFRPEEAREAWERTQTFLHKKLQ